MLLLFDRQIMRGLLPVCLIAVMPLQFTPETAQVDLVTVEEVTTIFAQPVLFIEHWLPVDVDAS